MPTSLSCSLITGGLLNPEGLSVDRHTHTGSCPSGLGLGKVRGFLQAGESLKARGDGQNRTIQGKAGQPAYLIIHFTPGPMPKVCCKGRKEKSPGKWNKKGREKEEETEVPNRPPSSRSVFPSPLS